MKNFHIVLIGLAALILISLLSIAALHSQGQENYIEMHKMIELSQAASDGDVEEIGSLYGFKAGFNLPTYWDYVKAGFTEVDRVKLVRATTIISVSEDIGSIPLAHKCPYEYCPYKGMVNYVGVIPTGEKQVDEGYFDSDVYYIDQLHFIHPNLSYEECENLYNVCDIKK